MAVNIDKLSFVVLISFGFGIGTDKTFSSRVIKDLKQNKAFIDKCPNRNIQPIHESDNGCTTHKYVARINLDGLRKLLWDHIEPTEICHTCGSLSLEYGHCDAIAFNSSGQENYWIDDRAVYLAVSKIHKKVTGECYEYPGCYISQIAEGMAGYTEHSVYVTPVEETNDGFIICDDVWNFFEKMMKMLCTDWEDAFDDFFEES